MEGAGVEASRVPVRAKRTLLRQACPKPCSPERPTVGGNVMLRSRRLSNHATPTRRLLGDQDERFAHVRLTNETAGAVPLNVEMDCGVTGQPKPEHRRAKRFSFEEACFGQEP